MMGLSGSFVRQSSGSLHSGSSVSTMCPGGGPDGPILTLAAAMPLLVWRTTGPLF